MNVQDACALSIDTEKSPRARCFPHSIAAPTQLDANGVECHLCKVGLLCHATRQFFFQLMTIH